MRILRGTSGFTLIEVLVAMVVLGITVTGMMTLTGNMTKSFQSTTRSKTSCMIEAERILSNFKEKSLYRTSVSLNVSSLSGTLTPNNAATYPSADEDGIPFIVRWPVSKPVYDFSDLNNIRIRPYMQIMGYMNAFEAIYNNQSTICSTGVTVTSATPHATLGTLITPASDASGLGAPSVNVQLQMYDISSNNIIACSQPANIRPPRLNESTLAADLSNPSFTDYPAGGLPIAALPTTDIPTADRGFLIKVSINHTARNGLQKTCEVQERFHYGIDAEDATAQIELDDYEGTTNNDSDFPELLNGTIRSTPNATSPTEVSSNLAQPFNTDYTGANRPHYMACNDTSYNTNVNIRLRNLPKGGVVMCRNLSSLRPQPAGASITLPMGSTMTFESSELLEKPYYFNQILSPATSPQKMIAGLYYPQGTYFCPTNQSCDPLNLPRFPVMTGTGSTTYDPAGTNSYYNESGHTDNRYYYPSYTRTNNDSTPWVPCSQIDVCNDGTAHMPTTGADFNTIDHEGSYNMQFTNLPRGCEVNLQIATVDASYQVKTIEIKEYIQEKAPGNKLCFSGNPASGVAGQPANQWFFACTTAAGYTGSAPAASCSGVPWGTPCCYDFPYFPKYNSHINP